MTPDKHTTEEPSDSQLRMLALQIVDVVHTNTQVFDDPDVTEEAVFHWLKGHVGTVIVKTAVAHQSDAPALSQEDQIEALVDAIMGDDGEEWQFF